MIEKFNFEKRGTRKKNSENLLYELYIMLKTEVNCRLDAPLFYSSYYGLVGASINSCVPV